MTLSACVFARAVIYFVYTSGTLAPAGDIEYVFLSYPYLFCLYEGEALTRDSSSNHYD